VGMLDATRLRVLVAVARYGSVTAAAHALNYAQPSISHHIARLEAETGAKLMERAGRGIRLTDAGRLLAGRAEEILGRLDAAEAELATHVGLRKDRVRVAAFGSALSTAIAGAAATVRSENPRCGLYLIQAEPDEALRLLRAGEVDIAVVFRYLRDGAEPESLSVDPRVQIDGELFAGQIVGDEPVYLITPTGEMIAPSGSAPSSSGPSGTGPSSSAPSSSGPIDRDLRAALLCARKGRAWIATGEQGADLLADLCRCAGFVPNVAVQTPDSGTAQVLAAAGLGVAVLPGLALRAWRHPGVKVTALPGVRREVVVVTYPAASEPPVVARLIDAICSAFPLGEAEPEA
jgi:DNA-binding transcriptional LysR family regulator